MNRKLSRYLKRVVAFMSALVIFFGGIYLTSFRSDATESLSSYSKIRMNRPSTSDHSGYLEVCVQNGSVFEVYVYFWYGDKLNSSLETEDFRVNINVEYSAVSFSPYSSNNTQMTLFIITSIDETAGPGVLSQSGGSYRHDIGKRIVGYHVYGNYGTVTTYSGFVNNGFDVSYMDDDETVYHLVQLYRELVQANANDAIMIEKLNSIMNSNASIDSKLSQLIELQEETNSWLEKIYNKIVEALGLHGEESTETLPDEEVDSVLEEEDALMQDTTEAENSLDFSVDSNSNSVVWNIINRVLNANPRVFGAFVGIMTLGVITLLLNR